MSYAIKSAVTSSQGPCARLRAAFFHSTPVLERKRRNHWEPRWEEEADEDDPFSSESSFFRHYWARGSRKDRKGKRSSQRWGGKEFQFCEEDIDVETIFRSAFGGSRGFCWSFVDDANPYSNWRSWRSESNGHRRYGNWRYCSEDEYDSSADSDSGQSNSPSDRLALGLSASGPLKLEDIKNAYRACALKWHPDRHQGSSKAVAEEKFKLCSAAYQSLCDKLAVKGRDPDR